MIRPACIALVMSAVLTACAGHGGARTVLPATSGAGGGQGSTPRSSNVALFDGTLWYGAGASMFGVPLQAGGVGGEVDASFDGIVDAVPAAATVAPDGTLYDLIVDGENAWKLQAYPPRTFGAQQPEEVIAGPGFPRQVVLFGDGISVLATQDFNTKRAQSSLATFAYGGSGPPIRTLALGTNVTDVASDDYDRIYVARRGGGVSVYAAASTCSCNPVRTIATGAKSNDAIAVSRDGIAYVLSKDPNSGVATIDAYAPGNNGPSPTRSIGPIPSSRGTPMGGITVDADGKVYVNFKDAHDHSSVDVYAANANGAVAPQSSIATPAQGGYVTAIAIGPLMQATPAPAPSGTLYVNNGQIVNAFPLSANGYATPQRSLTALLGPDFRGGTTYTVAGGMTTTADGRLFVVRIGGPTPKVATCSIAAEDPNANGSVGWLFDLPCVANQEPVVARSAGQVLDIATFSRNTVTITYQLLGGGTVGSAKGYDAFATDPAGMMYLAVGAQIDEFPAAPPALTSPIRSIVLPGATGTFAAAADGTVYAKTSTYDVNFNAVATIWAIAPGQTSPSRSIGPFNASTDIVGGLAVDSADELYVALTNPATHETKVNGYAPNANGLPMPVRSIVDPVPSYGAAIDVTIFQ